MMTCGIYQIKNVIDGKTYVGYSKNIERRLKKHFSNLSKDSHDNQYLQNAWNKYGEKNFESSILEEVDSLLLKEREKEYIQNLKTKYPNGYNLTDGGDGIVNLEESSKNKIREAQLGNKNRSGAILSQETRNKISIGNKGKTISERRKRELSDRWMGDKNPNYGKAMSEDSRKKLSQSLKGIIPWNKGKRMTEEARKNMSLSAKNRNPPSREMVLERNKKIQGKIRKGKRFVGVYFEERTNKYVAEIKKDGKRYRERRNTIEEAVLAYNKMAIFLYGESANLNDV